MLFLFIFYFYEWKTFWNKQSRFVYNLDCEEENWRIFRDTRKNDINNGRIIYKRRIRIIGMRIAEEKIIFFLQRKKFIYRQVWKAGQINCQTWTV